MNPNPKPRPKTNIEINKKYQMLTAMELDQKRNTAAIYWIFKCDCGKIKSIRANLVYNGSVRSCGCLRKLVLKRGF